MTARMRTIPKAYEEIKLLDPDIKSTQAYGKSRGDPRYPDRIEKIDQSGFAFGYSLVL